MNENKPVLSAAGGSPMKTWDEMKYSRDLLMFHL